MTVPEPTPNLCFKKKKEKDKKKKEEKLLGALLPCVPHISSLPLFATLTNLHEHSSIQSSPLLFMKSCAMIGKSFDISGFNSNKALGLSDVQDPFHIHSRQ